MLLRLENIYLTFGGKPLLDGAELTLHKGDRIALVGRNGSGKSTLLKMAADLVEPMEGTRFVHPKATIGYLEQMPDLSAYKSVKAYVEEGLHLAQDLHRASYMLQSLGVDGTREPALLSGGEMRRVALARILAKNPDIFLLDEPTNHLDIATIEWLENYLKTIPATLILISHDRRFLENISHSTVWLDRGQTKLMEKNFRFFEEWRDKILQEEEEAQHKLGRQIVREEHWLRYGVTARRKRNIRRLKDLQHLRQTHQNHQAAPGKVALQVESEKKSGKKVIDARHLCKSYGDTCLVKDFSIHIHRGDIVGFVGANGMGKTTLLRLLTKQLAPDSGTVKLGTHIEIAYFDQKRELDPEETLMHYLTQGRGDTLLVRGEERHVFSYMKDFLFEAAQARTKIKELSGGERARLILAYLLARSTNVLVLDEPTNDLDIETLDVLQEMLMHFPGTILLVSHDRDFLDRLVTHIVAPHKQGQWLSYAGGYSAMLQERQKAAKEEKKQAKAKEQKQEKGTEKAEANKSEVKKLSFKHQYALEKLPQEIEQLQKEIHILEQKLAQPDLYQKDVQSFVQFTEQLHEKQKIVAQKEEDWLELELMREALEK